MDDHEGLPVSPARSVRAVEFVSKTEFDASQVNHDKICDLKLLDVKKDIANMENRIKFAIYFATSIVGLVLILVQYYLVTIKVG